MPSRTGRANTEGLEWTPQVGSSAQNKLLCHTEVVDPVVRGILDRDNADVAQLVEQLIRNQ